MMILSVRPCQWTSAPFKKRRYPLVDCRVSCCPAKSISVKHVVMKWGPEYICMFVVEFVRRGVE